MIRASGFLMPSFNSLTTLDIQVILSNLFWDRKISCYTMCSTDHCGWMNENNYMKLNRKESIARQEKIADELAKIQDQLENPQTQEAWVILSSSADCARSGLVLFDTFMYRGIR